LINNQQAHAVWLYICHCFNIFGTKYLYLSTINKEK
jgi:hypothetical protein